MKSILVLNIPEDFDYRRCSIGGDCNIYYERKGEQRTSIIGNIKNLKPMPEKKKYLDYDLYAGSGLDRGWNACIDEILGDHNE
jgi:hypothetical protein